MHEHSKAAGVGSEVHSRAKFHCQSEKSVVWNRASGETFREYSFTAVYDDGIPENKRFAAASPSGQLTITVSNPNVVYEPGKSYYLDFTPAA